MTRCTNVTHSSTHTHMLKSTHIQGGRHWEKRIKEVADFTDASKQS